MCCCKFFDTLDYDNGQIVGMSRPCGLASQIFNPLIQKLVAPGKGELFALTLFEQGQGGQYDYGVQL